MGKGKPKWSSLERAKRAVADIKAQGKQVSMKTLKEYRNEKEK